MDLHEKAIELCKILANSLYDRNSDAPIFFSPTEIDLVKDWAVEVLNENAQYGETERLQTEG